MRKVQLLGIVLDMFVLCCCIINKYHKVNIENIINIINIISLYVSGLRPPLFLIHPGHRLAAISYDQTSPADRSKL